MTTRTVVGRRSPLAAITALAVAALLASACSDHAPDPMGVQSDALTSSTGSGGGPNWLTVCKQGPEGTWADFAIEAPDATLLTDSLFRLYPTWDEAAGAARDCVEIWVAESPEADPVAITITEVGMTPGLQLDYIVHGPDVDGNEADWVTGTNSATLRVNWAVAPVVHFKNSGTPTSEACSGLTPGYWRNWRNHYTSAQFESLLPGTIAASIAQADEFLAPPRGGDMLAQMRRFMLANQLTMNLTESAGLPNPSDGSISGACMDPGGEGSLADALTSAQAILSNPANYPRRQIEAVKDILDRIANMRP